MKKKANMFLIISAVIVAALYFAEPFYADKKFDDWRSKYISKNQHGLRVFFFDNQHFQGIPIETGVIESISYLDSVDNRFRETYFSARIAGFFAPPKKGHYKFFLRSDDGSRLYIDQDIIIDNTENGGIRPSTQMQKTIFLNKEPHFIVVEYFQAKGRAELVFQWQKTGVKEKNSSLSKYFIPVNNNFVWRSAAKEFAEIGEVKKSLTNIPFWIAGILFIMWSALMFGHLFPLFFRKHEILLIILALTAVLVIYFYPIFFQGKTLVSVPISGHVEDGGGPFWEIEPYFYLNHWFWFVEKTIPLWNPFEGLGMPMAAMPNCGSFSIIPFLISIYPCHLTMDFFMLLRLFLAGFFMCLLLREVGIRMYAVLVAGIFFMLAPPHVSCINQFQLDTIAFGAGILYFLEKALSHNRNKQWVLTALFIGIALLGGNPEEGILTLGMVVLFFVVRLFFISKSYKYECSKKFILIFIAGICLASFYLLPEIELINTSVSTARSYSRGIDFNLQNVLSLIFFPKSPFPFARPESYVFGILAVFFIFVSLMNFNDINKKIKPHAVFAIIYMICFLLMFFNNPLTVWLKRLPIISHIWWGKYTSTLYIAAAILVSIGFDLTINNKVRWKNILIVILIILLFVFILYFDSSNCSFINDSTLIVYYCLLLASFFMLNLLAKKEYRMLIGVLLLVDVFLFIPRKYCHRQINLPSPKEINYLKDIYNSKPFIRISAHGSNNYLQPNRNCIYQLSVPGHSGILVPKRYSNLMTFIKSRPNAVNITDRFMNIVATRYVYNNRGLLLFGDKDKMVHEKIKYQSLNDIQFHFYLIKDRFKQGIKLKEGDEAILRIPIMMDSLLKFSVAPYIHNLKEDVSGGVMFLLKVRCDNREILLFKKYLDPSKDERDYHWHNYMVDLSQYKGKIVELIFCLKAEGGRSGLWADIMLTDDENSKISIENQDMEIVFVDDFNRCVIYKNSGAFERIYIVHRAQQVFNSEDALKIWQDMDFDFKNKIIIEDDVPDFMLDCRDAPVQDNSNVEIASYKPNNIILKADMENDGFLVLSDLYYPGWKAYVDGKKTEIYLTNYLMRSIYLETGKHIVTFVYLPISFMMGSILSILSLLGLIIFWTKKDRGFNQN